MRSIELIFNYWEELLIYCGTDVSKTNVTTCLRNITKAPPLRRDWLLSYYYRWMLMLISTGEGERKCAGFS